MSVGYYIYVPGRLCKRIRHLILCTNFYICLLFSYDFFQKIFFLFMIILHLIRKILLEFLHYSIIILKLSQSFEDYDSSIGRFVWLIIDIE